ncbi:MAG: efflux RND transporter periplasmic adaptor subunit [Trueperaceae bacterium]
MKANMGGIGRWILIGVVVLAVAAVIFAVVRRNAQPELGRTSVERVTQNTFIRDVSGSGNIEADRERTLSFSSTGTVSDVFVSEGDTVKAGQPLAFLGIASLERTLASDQASLESARAELARIQAQQDIDRLDTDSSLVTAQDTVANAEATLAETQRTLETTQRLVSTGAASQNELTTAQNEYNTASRTLEQARLTLQSAQTKQGNFDGLAEAQVASANAQIKQLETTIANTQEQITEATLVAPFDGTITDLGFKAGDQIAQASAGSDVTGTITIVDISSLYARANFDENRALELKQGQAAIIAPDADTRQELTATLRRVGTVASRSGTSGAAQVEAIFDLSPEALASGFARPGYTITAKVTVNALENVLLVPLEAITEEDEGSFVYKITETERGQGAVEKVPVNVLDRNATLAATESSALKADDLIAVINLEELEAGDLVGYDPLEEEGS